MERSTRDAVSQMRPRALAASRTPDGEAAEEQRIIDEEKERSSEARERVRDAGSALVESSPASALSLADRGRVLAAAADELRVTSEKIQTTAILARRVARETRDQSISSRRVSVASRDSDADD